MFLKIVFHFLSLCIMTISLTTSVLAAQIVPVSPVSPPNDSSSGSFIPGIPGTSITRPVVDIKCDESFFTNKDYMTASDICLTAANDYNDISRELEAMDSLKDKSYWVSFIKFNEAYCYYQTAFSLKSINPNDNNANDNAVLSYNLIKEYHDAMLEDVTTDKIVSENDIALGDEYIDLIKSLSLNFPEVLLNVRNDFGPK